MPPQHGFSWKNRRRGGVVSVLASVVLLAACSVGGGTVEIAPPGAEEDPEGTPFESPERPSKTDDKDDADEPQDTRDAGTAKPGEILGTLSGSCGIVKTLLKTSSASFQKNNLAFVKGETYDHDSLSPDGQEMFDTPNAGGSSTESEVMSFEVLHACEGAKLLKTETEIAYSNDDAGPASITDILVEIAGKKVGVSVTRAYRPAKLPFPDADVKELLEKKLEGILRSSERVSAGDRWVKQILHVFAATKAQADAVTRVLPTIDSHLRSNTIVLLTETKGGGFVYCNPDPPLGSECP